MQPKSLKMSQSPLDELICQLKQVDLNKSEVPSVNYQKLLEKICCSKIKTFECKTHFLTPKLMVAISKTLESSNSEEVSNAANFIAELGKYETCRDFLANAELIKLLLSHLESSNHEILIQTCRALANLCFEKSEAQNLITTHGGLKAIKSLLDRTTVTTRCENDPKVRSTLVGFILNLISENTPIHKQVFELNVMQSFVQIIKEDLETKSRGTTTSQNVFIILVALAETIPVELIFTEEVCGLAVETFRNAFDDEFCITGLDFLEDADLPDIVKFNIAKSGIFPLFIEFLETKPKNLTEEEANKYDLTGRVLANILTGDEAMEYLYDFGGGIILTHLTNWLSSEDKELIHAAILCIGNIARTDKHSTSIVEKNIHKSLLNILTDETKDIKIQYAVMSTIRNLSIPRINKVRLVKDGLIDVLMPLMDLDVKTSSAVIFKLVGTLRQVIDGQELLALDLGCNDKLVARLSNWASLTIHPWVSSECCRCLCWLVKISKDRNVILNVLRSGGYTHIMKLLGALHGLMQSEAVSALTVTSAIVLLEIENDATSENSCRLSTNGSTDGKDSLNGDDSMKSLSFSNFEQILVDGDIGEKLKHLILQHGVKMDEHILENIFTFLEIVTKFEKIRKHFSEKELKPIFHSTMQSRDDFSRFRFRIEEIEKSL